MSQRLRLSTSLRESWVTPNAMCHLASRFDLYLILSISPCRYAFTTGHQFAWRRCCSVEQSEPKEASTSLRPDSCLGQEDKELFLKGTKIVKGACGRELGTSWSRVSVPLWWSEEYCLMLSSSFPCIIFCFSYKSARGPKGGGLHCWE